MNITNFGGNVQFEPRVRYTPISEQEVLDVLNMHAEGKIRVMASGHSWSDAAKSEDVMVNMQRINQVEIEHKKNSEVWATVGAGCVLQDLLNILHQKTEYTLPTMGGIKKQTISGAISTGTHGSGRSSLSHYMQEIRVAAYDSEGRAKIFTYSEGDGLRAARCALGCMGVILSVKFQLVPKYYVAQSIEHRDSLDLILAEKERYELQQFILVPYSWQWYVYTRRVAQGSPQGIHRLFVYGIRMYNVVGTDIVLHFILKTIVQVSSARKGTTNSVRWFFGKLLPMLVERKRVITDFHEEALTLKHELFQHLEMELFVSERNIKKAMRTAQYITEVFAGEEGSALKRTTEDLKKIGKLDELLQHKGFYTHHYPIYCRQVKPDDALISMTSGTKEWHFSVSFFTYLAPNKREHFYEFAAFVASCLVTLYDAKLHWGKYFPLEYKNVRHLYPRMQDFHKICNKTDPYKVFRNEYTATVLGFKV